MPFFQTCLECGRTYRLSTALECAMYEKDGSLADTPLFEPCLRCSNTPQDKRKMYFFWLGHDREDVTAML